MKKVKFIFCVLLLVPLFTSAQDTAYKKPTPKFLPLNYEEDYHYLANKNRRTGLWEKLKYIPLYPNAYMTFGAEIRPRVELKDHLKYGKGNEDMGLDFQQRSRVWTDVHLLTSVRVFAELQSGTSSGLDYTASPIDGNTIEVHQAFAEFAAHHFYVRAGRQALLFGKARLFDFPQPPNTRHSYDAARIGYKDQHWSFGVITGAETLDKTGSFNDKTNDNFTFSAAHVSHTFGKDKPGATVELLYLYTNRKVAASAILVAKRSSLSARIGGVTGGLTYDAEVIGQFGKTYSGQKVRAWSVGSESFYTFKPKWHPYVGIRVDISSGDKDSTDQKNNSFDFLWARGQSLLSDLGYTNLAAFGPTFGCKPVKQLSIDMAVQELWRVSAQDGLYAMSGAAIRKGSDGQSCYVGVRTTFRAEYQLNPFLAFGTFVNATFKGTFLQQSGGSTNMFYENVYTVFRF